MFLIKQSRHQQKQTQVDVVKYKTGDVVMKKILTTLIFLSMVLTGCSEAEQLNEDVKEWNEKQNEGSMDEDLKEGPEAKSESEDSDDNMSEVSGESKTDEVVNLQDYEDKYIEVINGIMDDMVENGESIKMGLNDFVADTSLYDDEEWRNGLRGGFEGIEISKDVLQAISDADGVPLGMEDKHDRIVKEFGDFVLAGTLIEQWMVMGDASNLAILSEAIDVMTECVGNLSALQSELIEHVENRNN